MIPLFLGGDDNPDGLGGSGIRFILADWSPSGQKSSEFRHNSQICSPPPSSDWTTEPPQIFEDALTPWSVGQLNAMPQRVPVERTSAFFELLFGLATCRRRSAFWKDFLVDFAERFIGAKNQCSERRATVTFDAKAFR